MGLFDKLKKSMGISEETEVSKLDFKRCDGFVGSAVQRFADNSIPICPICRNNPRWQLHVSQKTIKMFPLITIDLYYFFNVVSAIWLCILHSAKWETRHLNLYLTRPRETT